MSGLSTERSVQVYVLIRVYISYPTVIEILFTDCHHDIVYDGKTYKGVGGLMALTASGSELKSSSSEVTVTVSGIDNSALAGILNSRVKAAPVQLNRIFFTPSNAPIIIANNNNVISRYNGFISNYSLQEEYDINGRTATNTMVFTCSSSLDLLSNKIAGRKTNPSSQNKFYPNDKSMDRVPTLENASFDFGKKIE